MPIEPAPTLAERGSGSSAPSLVVLGGGQHARVVVEAARSDAGRWQVQGFVAPAAGTWQDVPWLGDDAGLAAHLHDLPERDRPSLVLGFGGGESAPSLAARTDTADGFGPDVRWATIIHGTAWVSPGATIDPGAVILAHAIVNHGAYVGRHVIVNSGAIVEHDVVVGAGSHIAPGAVIGGGTRIGPGTFVGLGARVRDHLEVGPGVVIGMGAVVVAPVSAGREVVGIPARERTSDGPPR